MVLRPRDEEGRGQAQPSLGLRSPERPTNRAAPTSAPYPEVRRQSINKDDHQKGEQSNRQIVQPVVRCFSHFAFALFYEPAGTEQRISNTQADTAQYCKGTEPAKCTADISTIGDREPLNQGAYGHALDEGGDQGSAGETGVPNPPQPLRLVAKLERHSTEDEPSQH